MSDGAGRYTAGVTVGHTPRAIPERGSLCAEFFVVPGGFVLDKPAFWSHLLRRGVATAASFPQAWHDRASFLAGANRHPGPERHVLVVRLRKEDGHAGSSR